MAELTHELIERADMGNIRTAATFLKVYRVWEEFENLHYLEELETEITAKKFTLKYSPYRKQGTQV